MRTYFFWLLLFLSLCVQAQNTEELDSLLKILPSLPNDTNKVKVYARVGWIYGETNSSTKLVNRYADSLRMLSKELNYERGVALSHFYYGFNARHEGNYSQALEHLNIFVTYYTRLGDSTKVANGLYHIGVVESLLGNYDRGLSLYFRILKIYKQQKHSSYGVPTALHSIGNIYYHTENYAKAIEYYQHCLQILDSLEKGRPSQAIAVEHSSLGSAYLARNEYPLAKKHFEQALKISGELSNEWGIAVALENLGYIAFRSEEYQEALSFHKRSLDIRQQLEQKRELAISLSNVGGTYIKLKQYTLANQYLLKSLALARETNNKYLTFDVYKDLSTLKADLKDFDGAYKYHGLYTSLKDTVIQEEAKQKLRELQTKYETKEKDKQITLLAKEKEIQGKEVQRKATLNRVYLIGLLFTIVVFGLVFFILRQRARLNSKNNQIKEADFKRRVMELEMKALQAQINPHFLFNCMNAINLMILKGQTENASLYLAKFSRLVRLILENAEASAVTLESEMALLESYMQLEELRLPGRFGYRISVDESIGLQNTYLPSMVLQPVVENAIWHGIVHKENEVKGNISIDVRQHNDELLCTVEDDGVGRDKAQQMRDKSVIKNRSLGMKITEERLRLRNRRHNGECIQITDLKDRLNHAIGTRVIIHIPIAEQYD